MAIEVCVPVYGEMRPALTLDDRYLPVPAAVRGLVRGEAHWACAIRQTLATLLEDPLDRWSTRAAQALVRALVREGPASEAIGRMVLLVLPPVPCPTCGEALVLGGRRQYCSDRCRRQAAVRAQRQRRAEAARAVPPEGRWEALRRVLAGQLPPAKHVAWTSATLRELGYRKLVDLSAHDWQLLVERAEGARG